MIAVNYDLFYNMIFLYHWLITNSRFYVYIHMQILHIFNCFICAKTQAHHSVQYTFLIDRCDCWVTNVPTVPGRQTSSPRFYTPTQLRQKFACRYTSVSAYYRNKGNCRYRWSDVDVRGDFFLEWVRERSDRSGKKSTNNNTPNVEKMTAGVKQRIVFNILYIFIYDFVYYVLIFSKFC